MGRYRLLLIGVLVATVQACAPGPRAYVDPEPIAAPCTIALMPLADYTENRDAADRLGPMIQMELQKRSNVQTVETGRVEEALARDPWMLTDRLPTDVVDTLGTALGAQGLLVGSVLAYGYRNDGGDEIPQVSLSLRLLQVPGGRVLWSAVHHRDGGDRETVFGLGRVSGLERLAEQTVQEIMSTFPNVQNGAINNPTGPKKGQP